MEPKATGGGKRGIRPKVSDLLDNALMRELMAIRIDTLWRMLSLAAEERLPGPDAEGATGQLDNKGALFVPGGLVFDDSDRKPIRRERTGPMTAQRFRQRIRDAMRHDNATLLYPDGIAIGVNLDNGFFADIAGNILSNKQAAHKRRPPFEAKPAPRIDSEKITRSHCPTYVAPPYGSRTRLSSCVAVCLIETRLYYVACRKEFGLRGSKEEQSVWSNIRDARKPVFGRDGVPLAPPCVVVCHTTRYRERNLGGVTRLVGYGKFGQFASLTMERVTTGLLNEGGLNTKKLPPRFAVAEHAGQKVAAVLRTYPRTQPGRRQKRTEAQLIAPREDLGLDPEVLAARAQDRYRIRAAKS